MKKIVLLTFVLVFLSTLMLSTQVVMRVSGSTIQHVYPGQSIQGAINLAQSGDTIFVHSGFYYEHVVVNKSVSLIGEDKSNTVISCGGDIATINVTANKVSIYGLNLRSGRSGVCTFFSSGNNISNNIMTSNQDGIYLYHSNSNIVAYNTIFSSYNVGIKLICSNNNTLTGNNVSNNGYGICLQVSYNNTLAGNTASSNQYYGFWLSGSGNNTLTDNKASNNMYNFCVQGSTIEDYNNFVDTTNTVDGKSIYYLVGVSDAIYDAKIEAGIFYLVNCKNVTIKDVTLTKNYAGIFLMKTSNSRIEGITASNNSVYGICLQYSDNNTIVGNYFSNNDRGIMLYYSNNNTFAGNTISNNMVGTSILDEMGGWHRAHTFFHNNFINNSRHVYYWYAYSTNIWDSGIEGNYWSNYTGVDSNHDGIGDTPHVITENDQDNHPLMSPWGIEEEEEIPFWMQWWFWIIIAVVIVTLAGAVYLKKRKPSISNVSPPPTED